MSTIPSPPVPRTLLGTGNMDPCTAAARRCILHGTIRGERIKAVRDCRWQPHIERKLERYLEQRETKNERAVAEGHHRRQSNGGNGRWSTNDKYCDALFSSDTRLTQNCERGQAVPFHVLPQQRHTGHHPHDCGALRASRLTVCTSL